MRKSIIAFILTAILLSMVSFGFSVVSTLTLKGGTAYPLCDINWDSEYKPMLGLSYEVWYKNMLSLGLSPYITKLQAREDGFNYSSNIVGADLMVKFRPYQKGTNIIIKDGVITRIAPFVNLGFGIVNFFPKNDFQGHYSFPDVDSDYSHTATVFPAIGAGFTFFTHDNFNLDLGVQRQSVNSDYLDGGKLKKENDAFWMSYLGIGYTWGAKHKKAPKHTFTKEKSLILNGVQFELDSAELRPDALPILDEVVEALEFYPEVELEIQGHTDITGSLEYNNELSLRRAQSVKDYLVNNGIAGWRLTVAGFGPTRPIATNDTPEGQAQNRRIEFVRTK